jgi:hypothetical protein
VNYEQIINLSSKVGVVTLLVLIIAGGLTGQWVFGWTYKEALAREETWKNLALQATHLADVKAAPPHVVGMAPPSPLPDRATPEQVQARLRDIQQRGQ